jgi:hypothetical protein
MYSTRESAPERVLAGRLDAVPRTAGGLVLFGNLQKEILMVPPLRHAPKKNSWGAQSFLAAVGSHAVKPVRRWVLT